LLVSLGSWSAGSGCVRSRVAHGDGPDPPGNRRLPQQASHRLSVTRGSHLRGSMLPRIFHVAIWRNREGPFARFAAKMAGIQLTPTQLTTEQAITGAARRWQPTGRLRHSALWQIWGFTSRNRGSIL